MVMSFLGFTYRVGKIDDLQKLWNNFKPKKLFQGLAHNLVNRARLQVCFVPISQTAYFIQ